MQNLRSWKPLTLSYPCQGHPPGAARDGGPAGTGTIPTSLSDWSSRHPSFSLPRRRDKRYRSLLTSRPTAFPPTGKAEDIEINVCKAKHLTNTRSSGADEALKLTPPRVLSLEQALEFIDTDELLEITPENIRIRKKILDPTLRKRARINR